MAGPDHLARLLAGSATVRQVELHELVAALPDGPQERDRARRTIETVDEEEVRLRRAVKSRDGFLATFAVSPYSRYIARWCARRGVTPDQVTFFSLLLALLAATAAATGTRAGYAAAAVLLLLSFVFDCVDGQLARYTLNFSPAGAWLDAMFDRVGVPRAFRIRIH